MNTNVQVNIIDYNYKAYTYELKNHLKLILFYNNNEQKLTFIRAKPFLGITIYIKMSN